MERRVVLTRTYKKWGWAAGVLALAIVLWSFNDDLFQISKNLDVFASVYKEINVNMLTRLYRPNW